MKHTLIGDPVLAGEGAETAGEPLDRAGVQSVAVAARILKALAAHGGVLPLKHLSAATGMPRAKVHRYLASLRSEGLVAQDSASGHYRIGADAIGIGLVGLGRMSAVRQLQEVLPPLRDRVNETVTAAIWGERGPTIIAMEESDHIITMNIRLGSVLPVLTTAIGRVFLAHLPAAATQRIIAAERVTADRGSKLPTEKQMTTFLAGIRTTGLCQVQSALLPGVDAIAAPVFDYRGGLAAVMCVVVRAGANDQSGTVGKALCETASALSRQLGFVG